jgi:hypothetical protein
MISDNASSHVVSSAKVGKSHVFSTFELSNMNLVFLPPNVTSVVRSLSLSYYSIFQNSIQVQTFAVGFVTI